MAVNLAMVMAQSGKKTVLVDADLRRPQIHEHLKLKNRQGLSDVLREQPLEKVVQHIDPEGLDVITSGVLPPNPAEVLGSEKMATVLKQLEDLYDFVILDGVPFLLADASVLSARVDGVLVVIRNRMTPRSAAVEMIDQLDRAGARTIGVALNRVSESSGMAYYKALRGYSNYAYFKEETAPKE